MGEITEYTLTELAEKIQRKELTSLEVVLAFIARIKEVNPRLNAIVFPRFKEAIAEAKRADELSRQGKILGRLHGIPITIKDTFDLVGTPSTFGLRRRANDFPKKNDPYVQRLLDEGAIILGKTNISQLLAYYEADNPLYGRTLHPTHSEFTCGGSSGGEGAIIAVGGSPVGLGTDLGGSVRIPAAFCGIMGIKPSMKRMYDHARFLDVEIPFFPIHSVVGPLGKSVEDLYLILDILNGTPSPVLSEKIELRNYKEINTKELKVGYYFSDELFEPAESIKRGIRESVQKLKNKAINCVEIKPFRSLEIEELQIKINAGHDAILFLNNLKNEKPVKQLKDLIQLLKLPSFLLRWISFFLSFIGEKTMSRALFHFSELNKENMKTLANRRQKLENDFLKMMENNDLDAILSPINALPSYLHGTSVKIGSGGTYSPQYNVLGFPAGVVPVSKAKKEDLVPRENIKEIPFKLAQEAENKSIGLPVVVQVAAKPFREDIVLALMDELDE